LCRAARNITVLREKHRSAQRRYRERLRAKHEEADHRVEALTRQLNQLKAAQVGVKDWQ
jgi:predicted RNase H-like nuclease (RuvC/YqgF family)